MKYLSLFSGIEAASVAWHDFGWTCVGVSDIDPFPCAVLKERFPNVPNLGDITKITKERLNELKEEHGTIDIVVGGSPCQSFSVAGKRRGLEDPRGNLMFEYCRVVRTVRPKYFIWENVPGALSSNKGRDFSALIGEMADIGYSLCWRVLDAKWFGVPQRRRRVFLVGSLGKNTSGFEILFEREGGKRDFRKGKEAWKDNSSQVESGSNQHDKDHVYWLKTLRTGGECERSICPALTAQTGDTLPTVVDTDCFTQNTREEVRLLGGDGKIAGCLSANSGSHQTNYLAEYYEHNPTDSRLKGPKDVANTITARYGTGGGQAPLVLEHQSYNVTFNDANGTRKDRPNGGCYINEVDTSNAITCGGVGDTKVVEVTAPVSKVRKLTPLECERLQGFPDNWTKIPYKGKEAKNCPTSPRYKALGNSMAVPVMRFIGLGIKELEEQFQHKA